MVRHLRVRQRDIEVIERSRLLSENCVHAPPTIDVAFQAVLLQKCNQVGIYTIARG